MTQVPGELHVANDVLAQLVGNAALECYGVVGMASPTVADGVAKMLPKSRIRKGINVNTTDNGVLVDMFVIIEYGTNITTVCRNLSDAVSYALTEYARVPVDGVNVHVQGVRVRK